MPQMRRWTAPPLPESILMGVPDYPGFGLRTFIKESLHRNLVSLVLVTQFCQFPQDRKFLFRSVYNSTFHASPIRARERRDSYGRSTINLDLSTRVVGTIPEAGVVIPYFEVVLDFENTQRWLSLPRGSQERYKQEQCCFGRPTSIVLLAVRSGQRLKQILSRHHPNRV